MKPCLKELLLLFGLICLSASICAQANDLAATAVTGNTILTYGMPTCFTVTITNTGTNPQSNYLVKLFKTDNTEITAMPGPSINPNEEVQVVLGWIPNPQGNAHICGKVVLTGDENNLNDQTPIFNVVVISGGSIVCTVGNGSEQSAMPVNMAYRNSLFETIYFPDEISLGGLIPNIFLYNNFVSDSSSAIVNIWMGTTNQINLDSGWIPSTGMTLVFSGAVYFPVGSNVFLITFNTPYPYVGDNLVILVERVMSNTTYSPQDLFLCQTSGTNRTRMASSDTIDFEPANPPSQDFTLSGQYPKMGFMFVTTPPSQVAGTIYGAENFPLAGATVQILNGSLITANNLGQYHIPYLFGTRQLTASYHGYIDQTESVTVDFMQTVIQDFHLQLRPTVSVTGTVTGSDAPTIGLPNATISLTGYENYSVTTNAQGYFTITGVYNNQTYQYTVSAQNYSDATGTITIGTTNYNMGTIIVNEIAYPPQNVAAVYNHPSVNITWDEPEESPTAFVIGYKVWRLVLGQEQNEATWTLLTPQAIWALVYTDNGYAALANGTYLWAVKAVYTGNVLSPPAFSNTIIGPLPHGTLVGTVRTWDNYPIEGATITAGTFTTTSLANGSYSMPLWPGTYAVTCTHPNYYFYTSENIVINEGQTTICNFITAGDAIEEEVQITKTELKSNYPNPFNPETTISYDVKGITPVKIEIYNTKGQLVKTLVNESKSTGHYQAVWNGRDEQNNSVSNGVYLYKMQAGKYTATHRMMLLK